MDKTYRKSIMGMIIPSVLALAAVTIMTLCQTDIIRAVMRTAMQNRQFHVLMRTYADLSHTGTGKAVPYYMFFCVFMPFVVIAATIIVVSSQKFKAKPGMAVLLFVLEGVAPVLGTVYNVIGGDKLLNDPKLASNVSILSTVMSLTVSPIMVITFVCFLVTVIKFIKNAKKAQRETVKAG